MKLVFISIIFKLSILGFNVKYEIKSSTYGGKGIFAKESIPKNSLIWKHCLHRNVKIFDKKSAYIKLHSLPLYDEKFEWISHVYMFEGVLIEILDDGKYWNHSEDPNTCSGE
jgi:SET domain-containing protein